MRQHDTARNCYGTRAKRSMDEAIYQTSYELGNHWAMRCATPEQLLRVKEVGDGKVWVTFHREPLKEFTHIVDPNKSGFMGTNEMLSASFIAGFIDGARTIAPSS
jgi:hypothetical protein